MGRHLPLSNTRQAQGKVFKEKDIGWISSGFLEIRMSRKRSEHGLLLRDEVLMDLEVVKKRGIKSKQKINWTS